MSEQAAPTPLWTLDAMDVTARLKPNSAARGLKKTENACQANPIPKKLMMPRAKTVHQPKNILGDFCVLFKEFSPQQLAVYDVPVTVSDIHNRAPAGFYLLSSGGASP
jgi:hypothetical protein